MAAEAFKKMDCMYWVCAAGWFCFCCVCVSFSLAFLCGCEFGFSLLGCTAHEPFLRKPQFITVETKQ